MSKESMGYKQNNENDEDDEEKALLLEVKEEQPENEERSVKSGRSKKSTKSTKSKRNLFKNRSSSKSQPRQSENVGEAKELEFELSVSDLLK